MGKVVSKLELGTWAERLSEMVSETAGSQSFETFKSKVRQITSWWDLTAEFLEKNSTKLGAAVQKVLKATADENPFPEGMEPHITDGFNRNRKVVSKLELGTWAEMDASLESALESAIPDGEVGNCRFIM